MTSSIALDAVTKYYPNGSVTALQDVTVRIEAGDFVAITGPSGCGKSTLLGILGLLDVPTEGEVWSNDRNVSSLSKRAVAAIRGSRIGFVFQESHLIWERSALENVLLRLRYARVPRDQRIEMAHEALADVGLTSRESARTTTLSGGERQRVALASALSANPDFLLCDEPTGNLDTKNAQKIMELIVRANENGVAVVLVTHNEQITKLADDRITMSDGRLVA